MKDPLTVATFVLGGVTFALVIITAIYVRLTGKIAKRMKEQTDLQKKEFDLRIKPQYDMPELEVHFAGGSELGLKPRVFNAGFSPFRFNMVSLQFHHQEDLTKVHSDRIQVYKHILPGKEYPPDESIKFNCSKFPNFPPTEDVRGKVHILYFFEFSDLLGNRYRYPEKNPKLLTL